MFREAASPNVFAVISPETDDSTDSSIRVIREINLICG
jgi:hypothetical protein